MDSDSIYPRKQLDGYRTRKRVMVGTSHATAFEPNYSPARMRAHHTKMVLLAGLLKYVLDILSVIGTANIPRAHIWNAP